MFGRGGEEAEYLKKHKIRFEIIPELHQELVPPLMREFH